MAYGGYGASAYLNGERGTDREDVGAYGTDEASLPSGLRIYANIMKHSGGCKLAECPVDALCTALGSPCPGTGIECAAIGYPADPACQIETQIEVDG